MRERERKFAWWALLAWLAAPSASAVLAAGFEVSGQVLDEGRAVAGAEIALHTAPDRERAGRSIALTAPLATVQTSTDGEFLLSLPSAASDDYQLVARAPGRVPVELRIDGGRPTRLRAPLALPPDAGCRVRVMDGSGHALAKVAVAVEFPIPQWSPYSTTMGTPRPAEGSTDAAGVFAFPCVAALGYELAAFSEGRAPILLKGARAAETITLRARSERPERAVRFLTADGKAVPDVSVFCCRGARELDGRLAVAKSNARGLARISVDTPLALTALAPDGQFATFRLDPSVAASKPPGKQRDVVLARPWELTGRVVDAGTARSVSGARVGQSAVNGPTARTLSGADGAFRLLSRIDPAEIAVSAPSYLPSTPRKVRHGAPATVELVAERRVEGWVVDEAGKPLADVEWSWRPKRDGWPTLGRTRGDKTGRFEITGLDPKDPFVARGSKRGYGSSEFDVPSSEAPGPWRVTLRRGATLTGVAVDESGKPVGGARITWAHAPTQGGGTFVRPRPFAPTDHAIADSRGVFTASGIEAGPYKVQLGAPGFGSTMVPSVELAGSETTDVGTVVLERGLEIRGRVVDAGGEPLAGVVVDLDGHRPKAGNSITDAGGTFSVADLAKASRVKLSFSLNGYASREVTGIEVTADAPPLRVVLARTLTVSGRVIDEAKRPVAGARVTVGEVDGPEWQPRELQPGSTTDGEGRFSIQGVKPGGGFLIATAEGFLKTQLNGLELSPGQDLEDVEVVLARGASVHALVLDENGKPAADASVVAMPQTSGIQSFEPGFTDREGRVVIRGVATGPHTMRASQRNRNRSLSVPIEIHEGENPVELRFKPAFAIRGFVVDGEGGPVAEAQVSLRALTGDGSGFSMATSDAAGAFELDGVTDGAYTPLAAHPKYLRFQAKEPLLVSGAPVEGVRLVLQPGGQIRGRIFGLERAELAALQVFVRGGVLPGSGRGVVNADATYSVAASPIGEVSVEGRAGERAASTKGTVVAGTVAALDLRFDEGVLLRGSVRKAGEGVVGALIEARGEGHSSYGTARTDLEGRFRIEGLTAGRHRVAVARTGWKESAVREVDLGESGAEIEIDLTGAFVGGQVVDAADRTPLVGAEVSLVSTVDPDELGREWSIRADARGVFVFHDVPDGDYRLVAEKDGYSAETTLLTLAPGDRKEGVSIELESADTLTVTLTSALGAPAWAFYSVLDGAGLKVADGSRSLDGGVLRIASLSAGSSFSLLLSASGFAVVDVPVSVPAAPMQVVLEREAILQVRVAGLVDSAGAAVRLVRGDGRLFRRWTYSASGVQSAFPLGQGAARLTGLPSGAWTVFVERDGAPPLGRAQVVLSAGSESSLVVELATP